LLILKSQIICIVRQLEQKQFLFVCVYFVIGELSDHFLSLSTTGLMRQSTCLSVIGPILWGHSGPVCHSLSLLSMLLWTSMRRQCATVATPGEWQYKTGSVRRLAVANGPNIFQMLLVLLSVH